MFYLVPSHITAMYFTPTPTTRRSASSLYENFFTRLREQCEWKVLRLNG